MPVRLFMMRILESFTPVSMELCLVYVHVSPDYPRWLIERRCRMSGSEESERSGQVAVLAAVCLAALVLPLSFSAGAVATPAIGRDLGGSAVALNWITNAFMLTFGSCLMSAGALADQ